MEAMMGEMKHLMKFNLVSQQHYRWCHGSDVVYGGHDGQDEACDEVVIRADLRADRSDGEYMCGPATTCS
ncbi:hypothetical protein TIFTF001_054856 [Ficus carica]|uniref:Uncharacterized protein n=1 Tax=Ficus carica TaxID=3494 RepID=A0AA88EHH3_FICCA|nr:hypothetical protein TIFTF001_054856 [Ficus carica]